MKASNKQLAVRILFCGQLWNVSITDSNVAFTSYSPLGALERVSLQDKLDYMKFLLPSFKPYDTVLKRQTPISRPSSRFIINKLFQIVLQDSCVCFGIALVLAIFILISAWVLTSHLLFQYGCVSALSSVPKRQLWNCINQIGVNMWNENVPMKLQSTMVKSQASATHPSSRFEIGGEYRARAPCLFSLCHCSMHFHLTSYLAFLVNFFAILNVKL